LAVGCPPENGTVSDVVRLALPLAGPLAVPADSRGGVWHLVSVNPTLRERVIPTLVEAGVTEVVVWGEDRPIPVRHIYPSGGRPGADRLAAAAAAYRRARRACIVVDAGTAITVDLVAADGTFLGGAIAPGRRALAAGLRGAAPGLPTVDVPSEPAAYPGGSTVGMPSKRGFRPHSGGLLRALLRDARATAGADAPVFVTGGDADAVLRYVPDAGMEHVDALVLEGVAVFAGLLH
jgi:type III pantothenate kinase